MTVARVQAALQRLSAAASVSADVARERDALLEELNLLRILASMGLTIAEFTHDFSHLAETMELSVADVERHAGSPGGEFESAIAILKRQFRMMRGLTNHLGTMMARNASRDLEHIELYDFARRFAEDLAPMFNRRGRTLTVARPTDYDIFTTKMHRSEWSSILLNLLTNAIKAADRVHKPGSFLINVGKTDGHKVFLDFSDDGDGIPTENRDRVFDAFFTTSGGSPVRAPEAVQSIGTGLGLKIVADIVQAVQGEVTVVDPLPDYATTIRIVVPAGDPDEESK